jgi:hypothetical protein
MDPVSSDNLIPLGAVDRLIGSYAGGINTSTYYENAYGVPAPQHNSYVEVDENGIPIVYIQGQAVAPTDTVRRPGLTTQEGVAPKPGQATTSAGNGKQFQVLTPSGFATTLINSIFSIAVTIAIIAGFVVVYLIIRTKQLHHHEEHVRAVLTKPSGHGGHAPVAETHAVQDHTAHAADPHPVIIDDHSSDELEGHEMHEDELELPEPAVQRYDENAAEPHAYVSDAITADAEHGDTSHADVAYRFGVIQDYVAGDDPINWRHALMDIDLILEDLLAQRGIQGSDAAERLSHADTTQVKTLSEALIARAQYERMIEGSEPITADTMSKLLKLYTPVFAEFGLS